MALGAPTAAVLLRVMGRGAALSGAGAVIGLLPASGASALLRRFLYGVDAVEPVILVAVAGVFVSVGILASLLPVRRMMRVDPVRVLRSE